MPNDIGALSNMVADMHEEYTDKHNESYPLIDADEIEKMMFLVLAGIGNPNVCHLIAYDGKKPVGFFLGTLGTHPYGKPGKVGIANDLYVVPDKRGHEVGLALVRKAVEAAIQLGAESLEAVGTYGRTDKRWEALGFRPYLTYLHMPIDEGAKLFVKVKKESA